MLAPNAAKQLNELLRTLMAHSGLQLQFAMREASMGSVPQLTAEFTGPDTDLLLERHAEVLLALEHLAVKALRLENEEHDLVSFDAGGFKRTREVSLREAAKRAVDSVQRTGRAYEFPPMSSRERRLLHLELNPTGLVTASVGEGPRRHLVLHPRRAS